MDELNACTECGFTTTVFSEFQGHIEKHEIEHSRSSSGEMSNSQSIEWVDGSQSATPSPRSTPPTDPTPSPDSTENLTIAELAANLLKKEATITVKGQKTVHVCPHCNFTTCMSQHMKSHLEAHERHQGQMYQCDICKMQFSQKANMHRHRMRHSGVKPYECRFCKKRFFRKDQMQEHSMTHIKTGFGFDCPVAQCSIQFSQHNTLRTHLEEEHLISTNNPAACKRCNLMFSNSRRLLLHYQTRHDDAEHPKKDTPKRKKMAVVNNVANVLPVDPTSLSLSEQLQRMAKSEFSPPNTESSDNSITSEFEKLSSTFPMTSQELLMMCFSNVANSHFTGFGENLQRSLLNMGNIPLPQIPLGAQAIVKADPVQLWSEQTSSSVSVSAPSPSEQSHSPANETSVSATNEKEKSPTPEKEEDDSVACDHCGLTFFDNTMFLLHKSLHTEGDPFKCALCQTHCGEKYMFTTHIIFADHSSNSQ